MCLNTSHHITSRRPGSSGHITWHHIHMLATVCSCFCHPSSIRDRPVTLPVWETADMRSHWILLSSWETFGGFNRGTPKSSIFMGLSIPKHPAILRLPPMAGNHHSNDVPATGNTPTSLEQVPIFQNFLSAQSETRSNLCGGFLSHRGTPSSHSCCCRNFNRLSISQFTIQLFFLAHHQ